MKVPPLVAASALLLAGVIAFAATAVIEHRRARARRPPPVPELEEAPPARRQVPAVARAPRARPVAAAPVAAPVVALRLRVTGPHGIRLDGAEVAVRRRGDAEGSWRSVDEDADAPGFFRADDLAPGRYDVRVEAGGMRQARLDDVAPGEKLVEVALARAPLLRGAVGSLGKAGCTGISVRWSGAAARGAPSGGDPGDDEAPGGEADVNPYDCTFVAEAVSEAGPLTVEATRGSRRESALVTMPLSGDPGFVCLMPPCTEEPASLLVYVADTDHREVDDATLTWTLEGDELEGAMGSSTGGARLFVHGRRAGQTLALRAERAEQAVETTTLLGAGVTEVLLTLPIDEATGGEEEAAF